MYVCVCVCVCVCVYTRWRWEFRLGRLRSRAGSLQAWLLRTIVSYTVKDKQPVVSRGQGLITWVSNLAALYKKDLQMSYIPSVSQVEFSRHAKAPQPTCRALLRQRTTSAERDKSIQSGSDGEDSLEGSSWCGGKIQGKGVRRTYPRSLWWGQ